MEATWRPGVPSPVVQRVFQRPPVPLARYCSALKPLEQSGNRARASPPHFDQSVHSPPVHSIIPLPSPYSASYRSIQTCAFLLASFASRLNTWTFRRRIYRLFICRFSIHHLNRLSFTASHHHPPSSVVHRLLAPAPDAPRRIQERSEPLHHQRQLSTSIGHLQRRTKTQDELQHHKTDRLHEHTLILEELLLAAATDRSVCRNEMPS
ncbi:hypothetical protein G7046_g2505 [Stylonectria norvegica]|nr:hypothetical protein G7046_g2505 [Stylonectria norvegica]